MTLQTSVNPAQAETTYSLLQEQITDRGPWQQTASGRAFFLGDPQPDDVDINDVAAALSKQCRYNGHCRRFYSVAEHSYYVSRWMEEDGYSVEDCYAGLHHDSAEAYTGDIVTQIKHSVPEINAFLTKVEDAVNKAFGITPFSRLRSVIKKYDILAMATEVNQLMTRNRTRYSWGTLPAPRGGVVIAALDPRDAEELFLARHFTLADRIDHERTKLDLPKAVTNV